jgi:hypothetical protein
MKHTILAPEYEKRFIDTTNYPPSTGFYLRGMAAAIQDSHPTWRPTFSELIAILKNAEGARELVIAGSAYGAAKQISTAFPGPKLLMYGAAVNALGTPAPYELDDKLNKAREKIENASLSNDEDIIAVLLAATERAGMGKISEMIRKEFAEGLLNTGKYNENKARETARKIVSRANDVRHRGVVDIMGWSRVEPVNNHYFINPNSIPDEEWTKDFFVAQEVGQEMNVGKSFLQSLVSAAQEAAAQVILKYLHPLIA